MLMSRDTEEYKGFRDARVYRHGLWAAGCWGLSLETSVIKHVMCQVRNLGFLLKAMGAFGGFEDGGGQGVKCWRPPVCGSC